MCCILNDLGFTIHYQLEERRKPRNVLEMCLGSAVNQFHRDMYSEGNPPGRVSLIFPCLSPSDDLCSARRERTEQEANETPSSERES